MIDVNEAIDLIESHDVLSASLSALLYASGEGMTLENLALLLEKETDILEKSLTSLKESLEKTPWLGLTLEHVGEKYFFTSKACTHEVLEKYYKPENRPDLSPAAYEVLAIIAYNGKVTRAQIENVRGVNSDHAVYKLLERGYIELAGHLDMPGHPSLFQCTELFFKTFRLESAASLPSLDLMMYKYLEEQKIEE